ncbi:MAG: hypothetical protein AAGC60_00135 [Acidobacteriota bacterium]
MTTIQRVTLRRMLRGALALVALAAVGVASWALWPAQTAQATWAGVPSSSATTAELTAPRLDPIQTRIALATLAGLVEQHTGRDLGTEELIDAAVEAIATGGASLAAPSASIDVTFGPRTIDGYVAGGVTIQLVDSAGTPLSHSTLWRVRFLRTFDPYRPDALVDPAEAYFDAVGTRGFSQPSGGTLGASTDVWANTSAGIPLVLDLVDATRGTRVLAGYLVIDAYPLDPSTYAGTSAARWVSLAGDAG